VLDYQKSLSIGSGSNLDTAALGSSRDLSAEFKVLIQQANIDVDRPKIAQVCHLKK
jgi:hypothetical protein